MGRRKRTDEIEFFRSHFDHWYRVKWEEKGKTATSFIEAIQDRLWKDGSNYDGLSLDYRRVRMWRRSDLIKGVPGRAVVKAIAEVLDIQIGELIPETHEDRYMYSSERANEIGKEQLQTASSKYGLSLALISGMRDLVDFDSVFPVYSPLIQDMIPEEGARDLVLSELMKEGKVDSDQAYTIGYRRQSFADHAQITDGGSELFSISRDGQDIFLSEYDMKYLGSVQEKIRLFLLREFECHRMELITAEKRASSELVICNNERLNISTGLSNEKLQEIDPSGMYTEEAFEQAEKIGRSMSRKLIK